MKTRMTLLVGLLAINSLGSAATISSMNKTDVLTNVMDQTFTTISTTMLNGKVHTNRFTAYFSKNGHCVGRFEQKPAGDYQQDKGTWVAKENGEFCFTWEHWSHSKPVCVSFYKLSNGVLILTHQQGFETMVFSTDMKPGNHMP